MCEAESILDQWQAAEDRTTLAEAERLAEGAHQRRERHADRRHNLRKLQLNEYTRLGFEILREEKDEQLEEEMERRYRVLAIEKRGAVEEAEALLKTAGIKLPEQDPTAKENADD